MVSDALGTVAFAGLKVSMLLCMFLFTHHRFRLVIPMTQETLPYLEVSSPSVTLYFPKPQFHNRAPCPVLGLQRRAVCTASNPEKEAPSLEFAQSSRANSKKKEVWDQCPGSSASSFVAFVVLVRFIR